MSYTEIKAKIDEMNKAVVQMREQNEKRLEQLESRETADPVTVESLEKAKAEMLELKKTVTELEKRMNRPTADMEKAETDEKLKVRKSAFEKYYRYGLRENRGEKFTDQEKIEIRALSDSEGGFFAPQGTDTDIIRNAYDMAAIRPVADPRPTGLSIVRFPSMATVTTGWGNLGVSPTAQELSAGDNKLEIHTLMALYKIPVETLEDAQADVMGEATMMFGEAIAEAEDDAFITGDGSSEPVGVLVNATVLANYVPTQVAAAISDATYNGIDAIKALQYKVKKTYRRTGVYAMNSTTEGVIVNLKDENGNYLWRPSVEAGSPNTFFGRPVINPEGMPDVAANAYPILFGDWRRGYKIRDRQGISIQRLDEKYAEYQYVGMMIRFRVGGIPVLPEAFSVLKVAAS